MPTVPRPLSYSVPSRTEPNICDLRFGFHPSQPPPRLHVTGNSNRSPGSPVTTGVPVAEAGGSGVPIDPVLLAESQSQLSRRPSAVVYHPSSSRRPLDRSKSQVTGMGVHTSGALDSDSGDDSEDDRVDEFGVEYESNGSDSDDGSEPVLPSQSKGHVRNSFPVSAQGQDPDGVYDLHDFHDNAKNPDNAGDQDTGAEYSAHHDFCDPTLGAFRFCETGPSSYFYSTRL